MPLDEEVEKFNEATEAILSKDIPNESVNILKITIINQYNTIIDYFKQKSAVVNEDEKEIIGNAINNS